jgi:hypothetical protein
MVELSEGITPELLRTRRFEIEVHDRRVVATASLAPLYDPKSERIRL